MAYTSNQAKINNKPTKHILVRFGTNNHKLTSLARWAEINRIYKAQIVRVIEEEDPVGCTDLIDPVNPITRSTAPYIKLLTDSNVIIVTDNGYHKSIVVADLINEGFSDLKYYFHSDGTVDIVNKYSYNSHYELFNLFLPKPPQPIETEARKRKAAAKVIKADPLLYWVDTTIPLKDHESGVVRLPWGSISTVFIRSHDERIDELVFGVKKKSQVPSSPAVDRILLIENTMVVVD